MQDTLKTNVRNQNVGVQSRVKDYSFLAFSVSSCLHITLSAPLLIFSFPVVFPSLAFFESDSSVIVHSSGEPTRHTRLSKLQRWTIDMQSKLSSMAFQGRTWPSVPVVCDLMTGVIVIIEVVALGRGPLERRGCLEE